MCNCSQVRAAFRYTLRLVAKKKAAQKEMLGADGSCGDVALRALLADKQGMHGFRAQRGFQAKRASNMRGFRSPFRLADNRGIWPLSGPMVQRVQSSFSGTTLEARNQVLGKLRAVGAPEGAIKRFQH